MFSSFFGTSEKKDPIDTISNIPNIESKITNVSGFDHLDIIIKDGDIIKTRAECQIVLDKSLKVEANVGGKGVMSGLWRSISTGSIFMNNISYNSEILSVSGETVEKKGGAANQGTLSIYSIIPGNIKEIIIEPSGVWCIHNNSFLACTDNINLTSGISLSTAVTGNGLFYTKVENTSGVNGKVWLTAYGGIIERPLKDNRDFLVHSGLFLAMKNSVYEKISVNKAGSFFTAIAGGEGIMMDFSQTDTDDIVYLQSGNLDAFLNFIGNSIPNNDMNLPLDTGLDNSPEAGEDISTPVVNEDVTTPAADNSTSPVVNEDVTTPAADNSTTSVPEVVDSTPVPEVVNSSISPESKPSQTPSEFPSPSPTITPLETGGKRLRKTKSKYYKKGKKTRRH